jgi:anti-sigma factor RsiW
MKEHLSVEQIRKYGERQLPPGDLPLVVTHLDECSACFAIMRDLFPQRTDPERAVAISFGETTTSDDDDEPWHLDFDAHLQRFVDGKFDEVEGEVIASHLSVCPDCAQAVRELREFKDSLRLRQLEREALNRPGHTPAAPNADRRHRVRDWWRRMSAPSTLHLVLAMSLLVALIIGGFFWLRSGTRVAPVVSQQSQPTPANHSPLIVQQGEPGKRPAASDSQTPSPTSATSPAGLKPTPAVLLDDGAAQIGLNSLGQLTGLDNLPRAVQETVAQTLRSEALPLPEVLAKLAPAAIQTRGPASVMIANDQLSPAWQVIKSDRPSFHWPAGVAGAQYEVTVFDERFNPISQSQPVSETSWQPDRPLPRGRTLNWQVKISPHKGATGRSTEPVAQAKFSILSQSALDKVEIVDRLSTSSHLVRGITYAQAGLLVEAEREFHILLQQNPESLLVKKLLTQVSKKLGRD